MIYIVGTGAMAQDYVKVLRNLNQDFIVIGRGQASADQFKEKMGVEPRTGGILHFLEQHTLTLNDSCIIATGTESLMEVLLEVCKAGVGKVLVEKPAALSIQELMENRMNLEPYADQIKIAYNRRFYASVATAQKMIEEDGGLKSMFFEFTEWAHKIEPLPKAPGVKENWFFANSTHVVDLAFFIAGYPKEWHCFSASGNIAWHEKTNFSGAGITENNVLFSYLSNWESAGRWGIELLTDKRKIILRPMEEVAVQMKGSILIEKIDIDDQMDKEFKPGLLEQIKAFLFSESNLLCSITEHIMKSEDIYSKIIK